MKRVLVAGATGYLGRYVVKEFKKQGKDIEKVKAEKGKVTGHYYRLMTDHVKRVLADIKRVYPDYDAKQGGVHQRRSVGFTSRQPPP